MSLTDAPTRRWPESQFRSLSVAQLPVRPRASLQVLLYCPDELTLRMCQVICSAAHSACLPILAVIAGYMRPAVAPGVEALVNGSAHDAW